MSQKTVQSIIGRVVTDEEYRVRFLNDPIGTLNELRDQGVELTLVDEIEALARTDRICGSMPQSASTAHLQRSSLRNE